VGWGWGGGGGEGGDSGCGNKDGIYDGKGKFGAVHFVSKRVVERLF